MITASQIVAHLVGDYILQSDWMATEKTKRWGPALAHAFVYSIPFLFFDPSVLAWAVMVGTHFAIDRWRLARYVVWAKNFIAPEYGVLRKVQVDPEFWRSAEPRGFIKDEQEGFIWKADRNWHPWSECKGTGYHKDRPAWLAVWLLIIADNTLHILINGLALRFL